METFIVCFWANLYVTKWFLNIFEVVNYFYKSIKCFTNLTNAEDIERGGINAFQQKLLRSQLLQDGGLSRAGQVRHREISAKKGRCVSFTEKKNTIYFLSYSLFFCV